MNENDIFNSIDNTVTAQPAAEGDVKTANPGETITQDGEYGWQSSVPVSVTDESQSVETAQPQTETQTAQSSQPRWEPQPETYTHTGAYAEASAKELERAAKAARKQERQQKKAAGRGKKGGFKRVLAAVLCGVLFGCATAGAFIGVIQLTGYGDQIKKAIEAADKLEEYSIKQENNISAGAVINTGISENATDVQVVYETAIPSVVAITNTSVYNYNYGFFSREEEVQGSGSGIVIGKNETELLIVTNYHVIEGAKSLEVTFVDDEIVTAYVKGTAEENDLAVVAVMLSDMKPSTKTAIRIANLASENEVSVGEKVVAIGNALGYGQVLTVGYISAVNREVTIEDKVMTLIQTDAAINPGNSGGALLNMNGEVIGINSAKYSDTDVEGMGFAIPLNLVQEIIDELMTKETLVKVDADKMGYLGVSVVNSSASNGFGMPTGAYVYEISENSPAAGSRLQAGDIITKLNDSVIDSKEDLSEGLSYYEGGTTVTLTVQRLIEGRYTEMQIDVVLGYRKDFVQE